MKIACLDMEGVLVPEIWINVAEKTGIDSLRLTTRDISDYDVLMKKRIEILKEHDIGLKDIQSVIAEMGPLDGAADFIERLKKVFQVVILSDTFYEFAAPLIRQMGYPMILCHQLIVDKKDCITGYTLRQKDSKQQAVKAFQGLNFKVVATGDSYNDTTMLSAADTGILFCPPENVIQEFPQFKVATTYDALFDAMME
ncbi:MAG: bifunctional phosphoserine phosphatase/homoserine phosphotransferase ThrH [Thermodesulfobacteriota bacterium]|nr:bifunctional phosphoserine phosphatase/homoserine phosphotransferase ThrH [Thermodesulfobacteriota bacterium]